MDKFVQKLDKNGTSGSKREDCKYWDKCYQTNTAHREKYRHPEAKEQSVEEKLVESSPDDQEEVETKRKSTSPAQCDTEDPKKQKMTDNMDVESAPGPSETKEEIVDPNLPKFEKMDHRDIEFVTDIYDKQIRYSQKKEYEELLADPKMFLRHKFVHEMPEDFFQFWEFCKTRNTDKPELSFEKIGLQLVGPFDYMAGKFHDAPLFEPGDYIRHWRFYYDPPEFQTVFVKKGTGIHYGYWRDEPNAKQCYVARNDYKQGCLVKVFETNLFNSLLYFLDNDVELTPFNRSVVNSVRKETLDYVKEHSIDLEKTPELLRNRNKLVVCKTFHGAGLVVPFDKKADVGYRPLLETDAALKKILSKLETNGKSTTKPPIDAVRAELQPIITMATIAVDESDFGTPIELGIDLFCNGSPELHDMAKQLLIMGYSLVQRPHFIAVLKSHLDNRKHGIELSILE